MSFRFFNSTGQEQIINSVADLPVGAIIDSALPNAPTGWLLCDGSSISRTGFPELFAAIGTFYGTVDANTFTLPDLTGQIIYARPYSLRTSNGLYVDDNSITSAKILDGTIAAADLAASARPGLVFVKSGTCSALTGGLSIDDCFSATYNNYRIIVSGVCPTSTSNFEARLRVSSTDATTAYTSQFIRAVSTTVTAGAGTSDPASAFVGAITSSESIVSIDVAGPFLAKQTAFTATNGVSSRLDFCSAIHSTATSYTGISFFPDVNQPARTLTITARVYGYANS